MSLSTGNSFAMFFELCPKETYQTQYGIVRTEELTDVVRILVDHY